MLAASGPATVICKMVASKRQWWAAMLAAIMPMSIFGNDWSHLGPELHTLSICSDILEVTLSSKIAAVCWWPCWWPVKLRLSFAKWQVLAVVLISMLTRGRWWWGCSTLSVSTMHCKVGLVIAVSASSEVASSTARCARSPWVFTATPAEGRTIDRECERTTGRWQVEVLRRKAHEEVWPSGSTEGSGDREPPTLSTKMADILSWPPIVLSRHRSSIPRWSPDKCYATILHECLNFRPIQPHWAKLSRKGQTALQALLQGIKAAATSHLLRLFASLVGEPGSIPDRVTGFSHAGIVPDNAACQRIFSGSSHLPRPFIKALLHSHLNQPHRLSRPHMGWIHYDDREESGDIWAALIVVLRADEGEVTRV
ncbi:hypothetical protein PR048_020567 [Dryococelus australis]|uniref:Uncharacterized protein n=1 Tax=Dryococelus australis TaxID=614101 RepID=A0ABQ9H6L9_9NEOP|nr:hypothetical protein PR048_020567 [Dryococelus australis]